MTHPPAIELARRLVERAPEGLTRVFFSDDGATAVEVALKMAFQYWRQKPDPEPRRTRFLALGDAYHGDTLGDVSVGGVERFHAMFGPLLFPDAPRAEPALLPLPARPGAARLRDRPAWARSSGSCDAHPGEVAAVVVEPLVQGAAGMIVHPEGYLQGLRELTREHGTLLIADEVAVGFGRTGTLFACEQEGVTPDFLCLAKGLTGGYLPAGRDPDDRGGLLGLLRHGRRGQDLLSRPHLRREPARRGRRAGQPAGLRRRADARARSRPRSPGSPSGWPSSRRSPHVGDVRQRGLIAGIELVADKATKAPYPWTEQVGARVCRGPASSAC